MNAPRVFIRVYGCQMNKLDAELVLGALQRAGYEQAATPEDADVVLYLTCSVREHAEERVYSNVGKLKFLKRRRPEVVIGILGCMAQKDRDDIFRRLPHVSLVCGTREFPRIAELIEQARAEKRLVACGEHPFPGVERNPAARPTPFQAYLSVMRGCDNFCTYCIVPYVRGREISRPQREVCDEARRLIEDGVREITLLGQNINSYGKSFGRPHALADLLEDLGRIEGLDRLRFVTSHPKDMAQPILNAMRDVPAVCEYLHMPAQAGSDRILNRMNRRITNAGYRELVARAKETVPGLAVASDFIVGFPGETEAEFDETVALVRDLRFQNCFVFKYSPRSGTQAASFEDDVPQAEKKRRNVGLLAVQEKNSREEHAKLIGSTVEVLVEGVSPRDPERYSGRTRTNHIVVFPSEFDPSGRLVSIRISDATALTLTGTVEQPPHAVDARPDLREGHGPV